MSPGGVLRNLPFLKSVNSRWLLASLRTALWIVVISVLVWVWADLQFIETKEVPVTIRVNPGKTAVLLSPPRQDFTVKIRGSRRDIDRFAEKLALPSEAIVYDASALKTSGKHSLGVLEALESIQRFRELTTGLDVLSAPGKLEIEIDALVPVRDVPVRFDYSGGDVEDVRIEPDHVEVLLPGTLAEKTPKIPAIPTEPLDIRGLPLGQAVRTLSLVPGPGLDKAVLGQSRVQVTFKVVQWTERKTVKVTVRMLSPSAWVQDGTWNKYALNTPDDAVWTREITLVGNGADLQKLQQNPAEIVAYIALTDDDIQRVDQVQSWWPGEVKVQIPPGYRVKLAEGEKIPQVNYRLVKRTAP